MQRGLHFLLQLMATVFKREKKIVEITINTKDQEKKNVKQKGTLKLEKQSNLNSARKGTGEAPVGIEKVQR